MSEIKHTPTPWEQDGIAIDVHQNSDEYATIWGPGSTPEGYVLIGTVRKSPGFETAKANAKHIIHCVNTYEEREALLTKMKQEVEARDEKIKILTEGMENILNPINYLQQEAEKQGSQLDGIGATNLIKDPSFYQNLARLALTKAQSFNQE